jgi:hypothetical protein
MARGIRGPVRDYLTDPKKHPRGRAIAFNSQHGERGEGKLSQVEKGELRI